MGSVKTIQNDKFKCQVTEVRSKFKAAILISKFSKIFSILAESKIKRVESNYILHNYIITVISYFFLVTLLHSS